MKFAPWFLLTFACIVAQPAHAEDDEIKDPGYSMVRDYSSHVLNDDGADTAIYERAVKVLKETSVKSLKETSISYSTSVEKNEILEAYTQKPDGKKINVPASNYQLAVNSGKDKAAPSYSDYTTLGIIFPDVAVNDVLVLRYKITQSEPMFTKHYSDFSSFERSSIYEDASVTYDYPTSLPIHYEIHDLTEKSNKVENGRHIINWTFQNKTPIKSKRDGADVYDYGSEPSYLISTFSSYAAIAEAYGLRAKLKAVVTPRIQKLADELTAGKTTPKEQASSLYSWVSENITFAGNCIGVGAVVPRDTDFVLDNKMGDCKDHATLLQALLKAKNIESTQALINASSVFRLPKTPLVSAVNHVINYIPSLNTYTDSTSSIMPFGVLTAGLEGKPVLLVDGFKDNSVTPVSDKAATQILKSTITLNKDGGAQGTTEFIMTGEDAAMAHAVYKKMTSSQEEEMLKNMPKRYNYEGKITMDHSDKDNSPQRMKIVLSFDIKKLIEPNTSGGMYIYPLFATPFINAIVARSMAKEDNDYDFACRGGHITESYSYNFPPNMKILAAPDDTEFKNDYIVYKTSTKQKGNSVTIKRSYDDNTKERICAPKVAKLYKEAAEKIMPNLKAQIVYK
jgi:transglutaminase-like putative cysteine protease